MKRMSSRRLVNRSLSNDGRSFYSGSDFTSQNRRAGCRSYLSSVRSESRSTLCSVMAQLTEEIQPAFESTLKSKAVSEDANVKFSCVVSGHPFPEVTWYKDDIQLDRYCGLPKYEISRDDKTHTLQIYKCTQEDAAIYQASAQNSRGIVSCSGVLEVGTMNEYKIHQNYFAKLKLKNENRRREQEQPCDTDKESVQAVFEHGRASSPERAQMNFSSHVDTDSTGNSSEEKAMDVDAVNQTPPLGDTVPAPVQVPGAAVVVPSISNSESITNNDKNNEGLRYIHDTVHNISTEQSNDIYSNKKLKISSAPTQRSKENGLVGRSEDMLNERGASTDKMEVQNMVTQMTSETQESRSKMDTMKREKQSVNVKKISSEELKRAQYSQINTAYESRNKMDLTDTTVTEKTTIKANKISSEESKKAQIASTTKSSYKINIKDTKLKKRSVINPIQTVSEESKNAQSAQITSVNESRNKMDVTSKTMTEEQSTTVNKRTSEVSKRVQVQSSVTESTNKMATTDAKSTEKEIVKENKSLPGEPKGAQGSRITSVTESRIIADITDTKTNQSRKKMDITGIKSKEKQMVNENKSLPEEPKGGQCSQITSVTESRNKADVTDTKTSELRKKMDATSIKSNEKQAVNENKSLPEEPKRAQGSQITSVTETRIKANVTDTKTNESRKKMDITGIKSNEKQAVNENKSLPEEPKGAQGSRITSVTESRNKADVTDTKTSELRKKMDATSIKSNEKQALNENKSLPEEAKRAQGSQITSVTETRIKANVTDSKTCESRKKMDITRIKLFHVNLCNSSVESKKEDAPIASVTESTNKMKTTDQWKNEKQSVIISKSVSEESNRAHGTQIASGSDYRNKMYTKDSRTNEKQSVIVNKRTSQEPVRAQNDQITTMAESTTQTDIEKTEAQFEKGKEHISVSKRIPQPFSTYTRAKSEDSMTTQTNDVVKNLMLTESSDKGPASLQHQALDLSNPIFTDNKIMDSDGHGNRNPVDTRVQILPCSCGGNDVNVDTGEKNASAGFLQSSAPGITHTEPTETPVHEDIPPSHMEVVPKLNERTSLMGEVTTETLDSFASQGQKLRADDQSVASTKNRALVSGLQNPSPSDKISAGYVSHTVQEGQITAMRSSLEDDTLANMCEKDSNAENQAIKESEKPKTETKHASMWKNGKEENKISTNVDVLNRISKEKSMVNSKHSMKEVIVQPRMLNSDQTINSSTISNDEMIKAKECQSTYPILTDNVGKMDTQKQSHDTTCAVSVSTHHEMQSYSVKKGNGHSDPPTFLSRHLPTEFTIPVIYITDVDSTSQNRTESEYTACKSIFNKSDIGKTRNEAVISDVINTTDCRNGENKTTCILECDVKSDLSLHSQAYEVNEHNQHRANEEKPIQGPESPSHRAIEGVAKSMVTMQHNQNVDKSLKTNGSEASHPPKKDLNIKKDSVSFIKQLKWAALDLEMSNQRSTRAVVIGAPHTNFKDNIKHVEEVNSVVTQAGTTDVTIPLKITDDQVSKSSAADSGRGTWMDQKTTLSRTKTEKCEIGKDTHEDSSVKTQPASLPQSVSQSPLRASLETHSPRLSRRSVQADHSKPAGNDSTKSNPSGLDKENQFKVPQIIRKIRPEVFDASGNLKLWCQFFNIHSDSTIGWYKDEVEIASMKRSAGDETQVCLAVIQVSKRDCGVYRCTITNEYGTDSTEYLLSAEFISNMFQREELQEVGEEIEMTPLIFSKGLADAGCWGSKFYGRVTTEEAQVGMGCEHKTRRLKVIYGLDPVFESGCSCFMKVRSPIAYESREETVLAERNLQITKQDCRIQNMSREYFKIFAAETRAIESFGVTLEVIPLYFMYWPASSVPYATVEAELKGIYLRYCGLDRSGSLVFNEKSEVGQKCSSFQHWIHQWTSGNVLFTRLEGVDSVLTNVGIAVRSKGYQGFPCEANLKAFEQFHIQHQCNYFCGLLNLKPLKAPETLQTSTRSKGSVSPLLQRRSSSSPQTPRKATKSPKLSHKMNPQTSTEH